MSAGSPDLLTTAIDALASASASKPSCIVRPLPKRRTITLENGAIKAIESGSVSVMKPAVASGTASDCVR